MFVVLRKSGRLSSRIRYIPSLLIESTVVFPIRFYYIFTTIVIVKEVEQYATKSTSYDAINGSNYFRH